MKRAGDRATAGHAACGQGDGTQVAGEGEWCGLRVAWAGLTDRGLVRQGNEDSLLMDGERAVFALADGLGGLGSGDLASRAALEALAGRCPPGGDQEGSAAAFDEAALIRLVVEVNERVHARRLALGKAMATTLAMVRLTAGAAWIAHVGDSRVYLHRQGVLEQLTRDHSLVMELHRQGVLSAEQMREHPQRNVITRAIGAGAAVTPSVQRVTPMAGDLFLLCTDGLTTMLADEAIAAQLEAGGADLGRTAERLVRAANQAGGRDNITLILLAIGARGEVLASESAAGSTIG